jgi:hypothetical protein
MFLTACGGAFCCGAVLLLCYLFRPTYTEAKLRFQLTFEGASELHYPDGTRFDPSDIVSTAVLQEVYERNELQTFERFETFQAAFSVSESNPAIERAEREFQDRLARRGLTQQERQQLTTEFVQQVQSLRQGEFTLIAELGQGLQRWPEMLIGKVMSDVLTVWAERAQAQGAFSFRDDMPSERILPPELTQEDYLVTIDRLRRRVQLLSSRLIPLKSVEGAQELRATTSRRNLVDLEAALHDELEFELEPIEAIVTALGLHRDREMTVLFLRSELDRLDADGSELQARLQSLRHVQAVHLRDGSTAAVAASESSGTGIAQLSGPLFDRVMELAGASSDNAFRQELVMAVLAAERDLIDLESERSRLERRLAAVEAELATGFELGEAEQVVIAGIGRAIRNLRQINRDLTTIHAQVERLQLQPSAIFNVTQPIQTAVVTELSMLKLSALLGFLYFAMMGIIAITTYATTRPKLHVDPTSVPSGA